MPWRGTADPYRIWVAEVMLQQTTVVTVIPYYERFMARFGDVQSLAAADIEDVLALWQGLGYYRRARMLHACAKEVVSCELGVESEGGWPRDVGGLMALPGIGPYTAAAIAACAFDIPANVVDGNVERVVARLFKISTPLPAAKKGIFAAAGTLVNEAHPRIYANAMMELGATVCKPRNPKCEVCPVAAFCALAGDETVDNYPVKVKKAARPVRSGVAYILMREGDIFLRKRGDDGLLGGLWECPNDGLPGAGLDGLTTMEYEEMGVVRHVFTHFTLELEVRKVERCDVSMGGLGEGGWFGEEDLPPLPTLMRKVLKVGVIREHAADL
ncbi:MAG: A/G-specific adenine glycosylase [Alphaproteobacteria bacterium CG_4_10_14_0_8_um_filter_53_9]|nr:MAG: A/G-specific adenine glycosylase [Alphaproteobacteria bacterium CG_4_10_14_0_8_um_filter_53_9]